MAIPYSATTPPAVPPRTAPAGIRAGAPLTLVPTPLDALGLVKDDLREAERELRGLVKSDVQAVSTVARYLTLAGGKRLRPALTALGARCVADNGPVARLMCCGELIHLGSLLHDDVVDDSELRRGKLAAHVVHGNAASVLTGDFCLARAVLLAAEEGGHLAVTELARAVTEMAEGEVLQLQHAGDLDTPLETYRDVIDRKSAALIAWCVAAPALRCGDLVAAEALKAYGRGVGLAFQITDDVLDYRSGTGKQPGADLRERKVTLPLLLAFEEDPSLRPLLAAGAPSDELVQDLVARITASGALAKALDVARDYVDDAIVALHRLPHSKGRDALESLGRYLVERTA